MDPTLYPNSGNRGRGRRGGRGGPQQQRNQPQQDDFYGRPPRDYRHAPSSSESGPQYPSSSGQFIPPQQSSWQQRGRAPTYASHGTPPAHQFHQRGPFPQTFHGTSPVRGGPPMWARPPNFQATRGYGPPRPVFSSRGQTQPPPFSPHSTSQQLSDNPIQKAWDPIEKQVPENPEQSVRKAWGDQGTQAEEPEKPTTSAIETVSKKKNKKNKKNKNIVGGTVDIPVEESLEAVLVLGSSSQQSDAKTKPEESKETRETTFVKKFTETTDQSLCSIPKRGIVKHSSKYFENEKGRPLEVNFLRIDLKKINLEVFQYSVTITPEKRKGLYRYAVMQLLQQNNIRRHPAYDGRSLLYSGGRKLELPGGLDSLTDTVKISHDEGEIDYTVVLKLVKESTLEGMLEYMIRGSSLNPFDVQSLDIAVMHAAISNLTLTKAGRSFFIRPDNPVYLGNGMELWTGHSQSVVIPQLSGNGNPHLYLNVDVAHKGFPKAQPLLNYIGNEFFRGTVPPPPNAKLDQGWMFESLRRFLRGIKVEYNVPGLGPLTIRVDSIGQSAREARFTPGENKQEISVEQYFRTTRNAPLRYPLLPCIVDARNRMFPMEFCAIKPNQAVNKELDGRQTEQMVRNAARPTFERKSKIEQSIKKVNFANDPCMQEFGLMVDNKFEKVPHYVLKSPSIQYAQKSVPVSDGVWRQDDRFIHPVNLKKWAIINTDSYLKPFTIGNVIKELKNVGSRNGIKVEDPVLRDLFKYRGEEDFKRVFREYQKDGFEILVVIIRDQDSYVYSYVKRVAELQVGILTQCIKSRTASNPRFSMTAGNILLKLNAKVGGVNHILANVLKPEILDDDVMLVGADVTHPRPGSGELSIAAVAASHDKNGFQYNMLYRLQAPKTEIIADIKEMIVEQIEFYRKKMGKVPKRILYYRDGVSESQFKTVLLNEVSAMKQACAEFQTSHRIMITVLIVQKRHHTRFFPQESDSDRSKNQNVRAGTVVDEIITHPTELDFYLVSHKSIQGTARPTKYHLLYDDSTPAIDQETLERLTYYLCHLFARCNRSVSYPAPTYYAHLAAFRAKAWWANDMARERYDLRNLKRDQEQRGQILDSVTQFTPMFFI